MASDWRAQVLFQMPPKAYRMHEVYMLVKSVVPKVPWSVASGLPWVLSLEKNFFPFHRHIKIVDVEMDGAAIYYCEAEMGLLLLQNRPPISGVTYPLCLKPYCFGRF